MILSLQSFLNMEFITYPLYLIIAYYILAFTFLVLPASAKNRSPLSTLNTKKVMVVFGSGGHTTEMLLMLNEIDFKAYRQVYFVIGHSDTWSLTKIKDFFLKQRGLDIEKDLPNLAVMRLFRSREVK